MEFKARNPYVNMRLQMSHDGEFKMPPPGVNATRYSIGGRRYEKFGVRCGVEGCWFAEGALPTRETAEKFLADHQAGVYSVRPCPSPPRRESLPSGLRHVEKLWRELDDVVEALASHTWHRDLDRQQMTGYAKALAFSIVMLEHAYFPDIESVARHARDRRRMRLGEMDYVATQTSLHHDATVAEAQGLHDVGPSAPTKTAPKVKPVPQVSDQIKMAIVGGFKSGLFSHADLAETYKLPIDLVKQLTG
jgi:hypothetical protein